MPVSAARYTLLALLFSLLWASGFVAIKIALRDSPPLLLMSSRFLIGGVVLLVIARLRRAPLDRAWHEWRAIAVLGVLAHVLYFGLTACLLVHLSAGTGAVLAATNPLMLALAAPWFLDERLTAGKAGGLVVSYAGVAPDLLVINAGQLLAAGLVLLPAALLWESLDAVRLTPALLAAQAHLIVIISAAAMMLWLWLLSHGDATRAGAWLFLNPVLGLFMAAVVLGEPLHAQDFLGGLVVGAGIYAVAAAAEPRSRESGITGKTMWTDIRNCLALLPPGVRWRWALLVPVTLLAATVEAFGAAAVFGLIKIIGDPAQAAALPIASWITARLPWRDPGAIVFTFTVLVMVFYIARNVLLSGAVWVQERAMDVTVTALSRRMLAGYLAAPWAFHFGRNSSTLIRRTLDSVEVVFRQVLGSLVHIVSETLVVAGIVAILATTAPLVTLVAVVVSGVLLAVPLVLTRRVFARWGAEAQALDETSLQILQQSLGALKEVKLAGRERFFQDQFAGHLATLTRIRARYAVLSTTLRMMTEAVFVCALLLVSLLVTIRRGAGQEIVPLLGLYAYAGFRVIPSTNRILLNVVNLRYGRAFIRDLYDDSRAFATHAAALAADGADLPFTRSVALEHVSYTYDADRERVLTDIDVTIHRGESVGIVGPSGAGKSTLIDLLLGLLEPTSGRVTVDGRDIRGGLRSWQRRVGYVPQSPYLMDDSLRRNVAFGVSDREIDERRVDMALRLAQLSEFADGLPEKLDTMVGERGLRLSGGQRQRVAIARALYHEPEVLVFDEATAALDNQTERDLIAALDALRGRKTLIVIAHRLTTVRRCDRLVFLRDGHIAAIGSFDDLLATNADFRAMATTV